METDLVLGVAIAPTALGLVLVRGRRADGHVLDRDIVDITSSRASGAVADTAKDAVLRTYATTVKHGYRIRAVEITCVGADTGDATRLVEVLRRVGCRNVTVVDPADSSDTASPAAAQAADMVGEPQTVRSPTGGRHRHAPSHTSKRLALGVAATGVLTVLAATVVVNATSDEQPAPAPTSTAVPVPAVRATTPPPERSTPRPVFTARPAVPESPSAATVEPSADPVAVEPPTQPSEHLPGTEGEPRLPGPA